jgi:hypothetical protein
MTCWTLAEETGLPRAGGLSRGQVCVQPFPYNLTLDKFVRGHQFRRYNARETPDESIAGTLLETVRSWWFHLHSTLALGIAKCEAQIWLYASIAEIRYHESLLA